MLTLAMLMLALANFHENFVNADVNFDNGVLTLAMLMLALAIFLKTLTLLM